MRRDRGRRFERATEPVGVGVHERWPVSQRGMHSRNHKRGGGDPPRTRNPRPIPCASVVLPAPSEPMSTTRSPARKKVASRSPNCCIASGVAISNSSFTRPSSTRCMSRASRDRRAMPGVVGPSGRTGSRPTGGTSRRRAAVDEVRRAPQLTDLRRRAEEPPGRGQAERADHRWVDELDLRGQPAAAVGHLDPVGRDSPAAGISTRSRPQPERAADRPRRATDRAAGPRHRRTACRSDLPLRQGLRRSTSPQRRRPVERRQPRGRGWRRARRRRRNHACRRRAAPKFRQRSW